MKGQYKLDVITNGKSDTYYVNLFSNVPQEVIRLCRLVAGDVVDYINERLEDENDDLVFDTGSAMIPMFSDEYEHRLKIKFGFNGVQSIPVELLRTIQDDRDIYVEPKGNIDLENRLVFARVVERTS